MELLYSQLGSHDKAARDKAVEDLQLGELPVSRLLSLLEQQESWRSRSSALRLLATVLPHDEVLARVLESLEDPNWRVRREAILALGYSGAEEAVEPLLEQAQNGSKSLQEAAFTALAQLGLSEAFDALFNIWERTSWMVHYRVFPRLEKLVMEVAERDQVEAQEAFLVMQLLVPGANLTAFAPELPQEPLTPDRSIAGFVRKIRERDLRQTIGQWWFARLAEILVIHCREPHKLVRPMLKLVGWQKNGYGREIANMFKHFEEDERQKVPSYFLDEEADVVIGAKYVVLRHNIPFDGKLAFLVSAMEDSASGFLDTAYHAFCEYTKHTLARLPEHDLFANIRLLLMMDNRNFAWKALCELLEVWPEELEGSPILRYVDAHLETWERRFVKARRSWLRDIPEKGVTPCLWLLRHLNIQGKLLTPDSWKKLFSSPYIGQLTHLNLNDIVLQPHHIESLTTSEHLGQLTHLHMHNTGLTREGLRALCESESFPALTHLYLSSNQLKDMDLQLLMNAPLFGQLEVLNLNRNAISDHGAQSLWDRCDGQHTHLKKVMLRDNGLQNNRLELYLNAS